VGSEGQHTQKDAGLRLSSEFTFPLQVRGQRAADRMAELRDGSIGPPALGDPFGPNFGGFRVRLARNKPDLFEKVGIETNAHLESTCKRACASKKTTRPLYAHSSPARASDLHRRNRSTISMKKPYFSYRNANASGPAERCTPLPCILSVQ
jgi:hypothetical protein